MTKPMLSFALMALLAACGGPNDLERKAEVDGYIVSMGPVYAMQPEVPDGLTPFLFTFTENTPGNQNGVTAADFQREAARQGISEGSLRMVLGDNAYLGPDGSLRTCTALAIRNGFCTGPRPLSVARRADIAQKLINDHPCSWVGFDPAYNANASFQMGASDYILNIAADCG